MPSGPGICRSPHPGTQGAVCLFTTKTACPAAPAANQEEQRLLKSLPTMVQQAQTSCRLLTSSAESYRSSDDRQGGDVRMVWQPDAVRFISNPIETGRAVYRQENQLAQGYPPADEIHADKVVYFGYHQIC
ncbi:hypothetical protein H671_1g4333 [Cricetulus griseus]|nr:hypothetical protein H671_1g4333 [Cricetulus griseus]